MPFDGAFSMLIKDAGSARGLLPVGHERTGDEPGSGMHLSALVVLPPRAPLPGCHTEGGYTVLDVCRDLEDMMVCIGEALAAAAAPTRIVLVAPAGDPAEHAPLLAAVDFGIAGLAAAVRAEAQGRCGLVSHVRVGRATPQDAADVVAMVAAGALLAESVSLPVVSASGG
jgi:hypothetical protein